MATKGLTRNAVNSSYLEFSIVDLHVYKMAESVPTADADRLLEPISSQITIASQETWVTMAKRQKGGKIKDVKHNGSRLPKENIIGTIRAKKN